MERQTSSIIRGWTSENRVEAGSDCATFDKNWVWKERFTTPLQVFPRIGRVVACIITNKTKKKLSFGERVFLRNLQPQRIRLSKYCVRVQEIAKEFFSALTPRARVVGASSRAIFS